MFTTLVVVVAVIALRGIGKDNKATAEIVNTPAARVQGTSTQMGQEIVHKQISTASPGLPVQSTLPGPAPQGPAVAVSVPGVVVAPDEGSGVTAATPDTMLAVRQTVSSFLASLGINAAPELIYGPDSGSIAHDPANGSIEGICAFSNARNFMVQLLFSAPYSGDSGVWDFGILFRTHDNGDLRVVFHQNKSWEFIRHQIEPQEFKLVKGGDVPRLGVNKGDTNLVQFVAMDKVGWLYVNNDKAAKIDLSSDTNSGEVCIAVGFYQNAETSGEATPYSDLTIWELR